MDYNFIIYKTDGTEVYHDHTTSRGKQPTIEAATKMVRRLGANHYAAITSFDWRRGTKFVCTVR